MASHLLERRLESRSAEPLPTEALELEHTWGCSAMIESPATPPGKAARVSQFLRREPPGTGANPWWRKR